MRRQLVWLKKPDFQGWGCSECAWLFNTSDAPEGNTIHDMKHNYERQRDHDFASHSCTDLPRPKNPKPK
jgi:hypothetical protein